MQVGKAKKGGAKAAPAKAASDNQKQQSSGSSSKGKKLQHSVETLKPFLELGIEVRAADRAPPWLQITLGD